MQGPISLVSLFVAPVLWGFPLSGEAMKIGKVVCALNLHDWRYASHAPKRKYGDLCGICQRCEERRVLKGFDRWLSSLNRRVHLMIDKLS